MEVDTWKRPAMLPEASQPVPKKQKLMFNRRQWHRLPELQEIQLCKEAIAIINVYLNTDSVNSDGDFLTVAHVAEAASAGAVKINGIAVPAELRLLRLPPNVAMASFLVRKFQAQKFGVSVAGGAVSAAASAVAAIACFDAHVLILFSQTLSTLFYEVILGSSTVSKRFNPNPNSNCSIAPQIELIRSATDAIHRELNIAAGSATVVAAMEGLRLAIVAIGKLMFAQFSELVSQVSISGLPVNLYLSPNPSPFSGFSGAKFAMAAYSAELDYLSNPVLTTDKQVHNSDISVEVVSARLAADAVKIVHLICSTYMVTLCQAVDLRRLERDTQATMAEIVEAAATETIFRRCPSCRLSVENDLLEAVTEVSVYNNIARAGSNPASALLLQLRHVLSEHALRSVTLTGGSGDAAAFIGSIPAFESRFKQLMDKEVGERWQRFGYGELGVGNGMEMDPIYRFVRTELVTEMLSEDGVNSPGEDIEKVYNAFVERKPLLRALLSY